ncbi:hypothetical protein [Gordonia sp. (in: high G+C Gram-positive bacteria)]|uniref:hypothetical protein n=1 Tax=Gordonia sp. (in: high G+C Gram-positive bacteria) TaxID=84139 RepID=UPI003F9CCE72
MQITNLVGRTGWWVFVIAQFTAELAMPSFGGAYVPLTDAGDFDGIENSFATSNAFTTVSFVALFVTVLAAVARAIIVRRLWLGIAVVAAPMVGGSLIIWALDHLAVGSVPSLSRLAVFAIVLLGVAIREFADRACQPFAIGEE